MNTQTSSIAKTSSNLSEMIKARLVALAFAGAMLFTVGFAQSAPLHNAAHDTRHVEVFPCH
ncbi:MAG: CbtB-domain containing protein [Magnetovibrio sp.]|nr:CbtB-domain containing protein [Magnetovibrio sp.]